jgi:hypothetical protein
MSKRYIVQHQLECSLSKFVNNCPILLDHLENPAAIIMIKQKIHKKYLDKSLLNNLLIAKFGAGGFQVEVRECGLG